MPTGNMSSEPGGCTASNHSPEAIQCRWCVKLMLFFFKSFAASGIPERCSKKVLYRYTASHVCHKIEAMCRYTAGLLPPLLPTLCCFSDASCRKTAHLELQECMPCAAVPVPLNCRTSAASLQTLCGFSLAATLQALCCSPAGPVLFQRLPVAVSMQAP